MTDTAFEKRNRNQVEQTREAQGRRLSPPVDIFENNDGFLIVADLPGVEAESLSVEYNPPELHVRAQTAGNGAGPVVYERRFELGNGVDASNIDAQLQRGVLRVTLKKSPELRPRRIAVSASS
jgi:HSP20 family protein